MVFRNAEDAVQPSAWDTLKENLRAEFEQNRKGLKEIDLLIEQSQLEVNKLAQRNGAISGHLQQVQAQFDSMPRPDIRSAYDTALDAQQRLFVMRGQLDKLQSDRGHIQKHLATLEQILRAMEGGFPQDRSHKGHAASTAQTLEMMIKGQEAERQRLARQMHDGPAQAMSNFILQTEIAMRLFDIDQTKAREELNSLKTAATSTFQKVRDFIFELRPMMLDDLGLTPTLNRYVEAFREQTGLDTRLTITGMEQRLEPYLEVMIFRAIQELLSNAARHSQAAQVRIQLDANDSDVRLTVDDNGKGFDIKALPDSSGMGLKVIRERVDMLGGRLEVDSVIGQGARVMFQIPATKTKVFT